MNYLCIDYWTKKCWLAVSVENIAFPIWIIETNKIIPVINKIIKEKWISSIVLWLAYNVDWTISLQAKRTRSFANLIKQNIPNIKIIFHDERFSSFEAKTSLINIWETNFDSKKLDDIAATIVLQSFLDKNSLNN